MSPRSSGLSAGSANTRAAQSEYVPGKQTLVSGSSSLPSVGEVMNRRFKVQTTKTLSDPPLLLGEIVRRSDVRNARKEKLRASLRKLAEISIRALRFSE